MWARSQDGYAGYPAQWYMSLGTPYVFLSWNARSGGSRHGLCCLLCIVCPLAENKAGGGEHGCSVGIVVATPGPVVHTAESTNVSD